MTGPYFTQDKTTCNSSDNLTFSTYQNIHALLHLFSTRFDTDTKRCNLTIRDGKLAISIWYKDEWHVFLLDENDYHLLPDTLFHEIIKMLNKND